MCIFLSNQRHPVMLHPLMLSMNVPTLLRYATILVEFILQRIYGLTYWAIGSKTLIFSTEFGSISIIL